MSRYVFEDGQARPISLYDVENCYYCTAAALRGVSVSDLITDTEIMQQDAASLEEIERLLVQARLYAEPPIPFVGVAAATEYLRGSAPGSAFGVAYMRAAPVVVAGAAEAPRAAGHMVAAIRYAGELLFVDFQPETPRMADRLDSSVREVYVFPTNVTPESLAENPFVLSALGHAKRDATMR